MSNSKPPSEVWLTQHDAEQCTDKAPRYAVAKHRYILASEAESLRRDAERYRWLRGCTAGEWEKLNGRRIDHGMAALDAAIDAALGPASKDAL